MRPDHPSATALRVAMRRAAHQLLDHPPVLEDPVALRIIGAEARDALTADPLRFESSPVSPFLRAFLAVRSRLAEDELSGAVQRGVRQYVILGAGLDTFAYRTPHTGSGLRVFEVDHPSTQAWKRRLLADADIPTPANLRFVPLDLATAALPEALADEGFRTDRPAFVSLLGVSMYLTPAALRSTLGFVASLPPGSGIVLDYATPRPVSDGVGRRVFDAMAERVGRTGEPWITFFDAPQLARELLDLGLGTVEDLGQEEIRARYLRDRSDDLRTGSLARLAIAWVTPEH